jgi:hypothetical protein
MIMAAYIQQQLKCYGVSGKNESVPSICIRFVYIPFCMATRY